MINKNIPGLYRRTWVEISLDNLKNNYFIIKKHIESNTKMCCVIKADAYGLGAVKVAKLYEEIGADYLAVSNIQEALQLRKNNINIPILILGYTPIDCAELISDYNITQTIYSYEYGIKLAEKLQIINKKIKIHIKIDSGMGRIGFKLDDVNNILKICNQSAFIIEGMFTHFANANFTKQGIEYTKKQFNYFCKIVDLIKAKGIELNIIHCCNSTSILLNPDYQLDMVRAGIILYGFGDDDTNLKKLGIRTTISLHSIISHIKDVRKGESIGYSCCFVASKKMKIATISIGYADGFKRLNNNENYYLSINGQKAKIVGNICMDQMMVDVTNINCQIGDEVILFGDDIASTVDDIATINKTINYEIICSIGKRVPKAYVENNAIIEWYDSIS